jgi:GT2 family glycosyltransferase
VSERADIGVVVVSWNDAAELYDAVASLADAKAKIPAGGPSVGLTVVVNGGGDLRAEEVVARFPGARVVSNERNVGFGPAANQAASLTPAEILLFVNPDTRAEGEPFSPLAAGFRERPEAVALAPRLLDPEEADHSGARPLAPPGSEDQFTFQLRKLPTIASDARELMLFDHWRADNAARRRFRYADRDRQEPFPVEQAAAAALAVRAEAFRRAGGFWEDLVPAWFEDVDLCARLAPLGQILYWPAARFRHRGGVSAGRLGYARFLPIYYRNALRYRRRHYRPAARAAYRGLLVLGMLLRLAALPFRRVDPRPKGESARAYVRVLGLALGLSRPPAAGD